MLKVINNIEKKLYVMFFVFWVIKNKKVWIDIDG